MGAAALSLGLGLMLPPVVADEAPPDAEPADAPPGEELGGFHGFSSFGTHAHGKVAEITGYLNQFREDNRIVGAVTEINGPPANSRNIAAAFQRGEAATFVYGVIGGGGGERGTLPDPPPGEANAYYPTEPFEMTFEGPVTSAGGGQIVDGRFYAKASGTPTGRADAQVTKLTQEGAFSVEFATVVSHTEPADGGVVAEAVSVLRNIAVGPLLIETLVSRTYAFVPAMGGEPKGVASTVIEGATINGTPVKITEEGVVVADTTSPLNQDEINAAFAEAEFEQVRLLPSIAQPSDDGASVTTEAGALQVVKYDEAFGAANPQGLSGGGFSLGGGAARVSTRLCAPDCPAPGLIGLPDDPVPVDDAAPVPVEASAPQPSEEFAAAPEMFFEDTAFDLPATFDVPAGGGFATPDPGPAGPASGETTAVTPPSMAPAGPTETAAPVARTGALAAAALGPEEARWVRDLYLAIGVGFIVLYVGSRLARAF